MLLYRLLVVDFTYVVAWLVDFTYVVAWLADFTYVVAWLDMTQNYLSYFKKIWQVLNNEKIPGLSLTKVCDYKNVNGLSI